MKVSFKYILLLGVVLVGCTIARADEDDKKKKVEPSSSTVQHDTLKKISEKQVGDTLVFDDYDDDEASGIAIVDYKKRYDCIIPEKAPIAAQVDFYPIKTDSIQITEIVTPTTEPKIIELSVYPNPSSSVNERLTIHHTSTGTVSLSLVDMTGKTLKSWSTADASSTLDRPAAGMYCLRLSSTEGEIATRIIVK